MTETITYFTQLPFWELIAVVSALIYVVLAAKENIWCWPAALISTLIYTVIFYDVYLWMDSLLQVYYLAMAIYGWFCWQHIAQDKQPVNQIQSWPLHLHLKVIVVLTVVSFVFGWFMANFTPADFPYLDSATTVFAVFSTYLVAKKVLENWLYWIVIDAVSIYLYIEKALEPTAVLFGLYVVMAAYGYWQWAKKYKHVNRVSTDSSPLQS
ncbi:nicotinamide riboside transporter PnuC [Colwelliaceae bacterium 6441]